MLTYSDAAAPGPNPDVQTTVAEHVKSCRVLVQPHRMMQRRDEHGGAEADVIGVPPNVARDDQRRSAQPIAGEVCSASQMALKPNSSPMIACSVSSEYRRFGACSSGHGICANTSKFIWNSANKLVGSVLHGRRRYGRRHFTFSLQLSDTLRLVRPAIDRNPPAPRDPSGMINSISQQRAIQAASIRLAAFASVWRGRF